MSVARNDRLQSLGQVRWSSIFKYHLSSLSRNYWKILLVGSWYKLAVTIMLKTPSEIAFIGFGLWSLKTFCLAQHSWLWPLVHCVTLVTLIALVVTLGALKKSCQQPPLTELHAWMKMVPCAKLREKNDPRSPKIKIYSPKKLSAFNLPSWNRV